MPPTLLEEVIDVQAQTLPSLHDLTHFRLMTLDALLQGKARRGDKKHLRQLAQELLAISNETLYRDTYWSMRAS